ncbi:MAG: Gfo/Idh/MocA family oxidoreductase, partial [Ferruginibacter sp.]
MEKNTGSSRRRFLRSFAATAAAVAVGTSVFATDKRANVERLKRKSVGANDNMNIALIGAGGMGTQDTITALKVPGIKLVAICDLYDGRLADAKKKWGADLYTTRSYKEILNRNDVDAVIVATPDHWHQQISINAMKAGKHVYCEKPMIHGVSEGPAVIKA